MRRAVLISTMLCGLLAFPATSRAQVPPVLRAGTRPMWAAMGIGGAINVKDHFGQFKLTEEFGYHFSGTSAGPAIVGILQESFGNNIITFEVGPRFQWDIQVNEALGVYLSPHATLGLGVASVTNADTYAAFNLEFGFRGSMVIGDRGYVFFQPLGFDMGIRGEGVTVRYDLLFGGGATF